MATKSSLLLNKARKPKSASRRGPEVKEKEADVRNRMAVLVDRMTSALKIGWRDGNYRASSSETEQLRSSSCPVLHWSCSDLVIQRQALKAIGQLLQLLLSEEHALSQMKGARNESQAHLRQALLALDGLLLSQSTDIKAESAAWCARLAVSSTRLWVGCMGRDMAVTISSLVDHEDGGIARDASLALLIAIQQGHFGHPLKPSSFGRHSTEVASHSSLWRCLESAGFLHRIHRQLSIHCQLSRTADVADPGATSECLVLQPGQRSSLAAKASSSQWQHDEHLLMLHLLLLCCILPLCQVARERVKADRSWQQMTWQLTGHQNRQVATAAVACAAALCDDEPFLASSALASFSSHWQALLLKCQDSLQRNEAAEPSGHQQRTIDSQQLLVATMGLSTALLRSPAFGLLLRSPLAAQILRLVSLCLQHLSLPPTCQPPQNAKIDHSTEFVQSHGLVPHFVFCNIFNTLPIESLNAAVALLKWPGQHHKSFSIDRVSILLHSAMQRMEGEQGGKQQNESKRGAKSKEEQRRQQQQKQQRMGLWQVAHWLAAYRGCTVRVDGEMEDDVIRVQAGGRQQVLLAEQSRCWDGEEGMERLAETVSHAAVAVLHGRLPQSSAPPSIAHQPITGLHHMCEADPDESSAVLNAAAAFASARDLRLAAYFRSSMCRALTWHAAEDWLPSIIRQLALATGVKGETPKMSHSTRGISGSTASGDFSSSSESCSLTNPSSSPPPSFPTPPLASGSAYPPSLPALPDTRRGSQVERWLLGAAVVGAAGGKWLRVVEEEGVVEAVSNVLMRTIHDEQTVVKIGDESGVAACVAEARAQSGMDLQGEEPYISLSGLDCSLSLHCVGTCDATHSSICSLPLSRFSSSLSSLRQWALSFFWRPQAAWEGHDAVSFTALKALAMIGAALQQRKADGEEGICRPHDLQGSNDRKASDDDTWQLERILGRNVVAVLKSIRDDVSTAPGLRHWAACCLALCGNVGFPSRISHALEKLLADDADMAVADVAVQHSDGHRALALNFVLAARCASLMSSLKDGGGISGDHVASLSLSRHVSWHAFAPILKFILMGKASLPASTHQQAVAISRKLNLWDLHQMLISFTPIWGMPVLGFELSAAMPQTDSSVPLSSSSSLSLQHKTGGTIVSLSASSLAESPSLSNRHEEREEDVHSAGVLQLDQEHSLALDNSEHSLSMPAQAAVLYASCPFLAALLRSNMKESTSGCIKVPDLHPSHLYTLVFFLYTSKLIFSCTHSFPQPSPFLPAASLHCPSFSCSNCLEGSISLGSLAQVWLLDDLGLCCEAFVLRHLHSKVGIEVGWGSVESSEGTTQSSNIESHIKHSGIRPNGNNAATIARLAHERGLWSIVAAAVQQMAEDMPQLRQSGQLDLLPEDVQRAVLDAYVGMKRTGGLRC